MINYSIPKAHPLVGHFIQINSNVEYNRMKELVEGSDFKVVEEYTSKVCYRFKNNMTCSWSTVNNMSGQQITLSELEQLVELSKIKLPQVMEVSDDKAHWYKREVLDFYKGQPVVTKINNQYTASIHFRPINPHQAEIEKLEAGIKAAQAKIETLKNASK